MGKRFFFCVALLVGIMLAPGMIWAQNQGRNGGLGPLPLRSFFPSAFPFLDFMADQALTLPKRELRITYQYALSNTFFNTETEDMVQSGSPIITLADVKRGLTTADFTPEGYGFYLDVETDRHQLFFQYGYGERLELGLELAWVSLGGGSLDSFVLDIERFFGSVNKARLTQNDQFHYYLVRDGQFIHATSQPFSMAAQDPVFRLKWNLSQGSVFMPAVSIGFAFKFPLQSNPGGPQKLVSSGERDTGYSLLVSKRIGSLLAYFQLARNQLTIPEEHFEQVRKFRLFALEQQFYQRHGIIVQFVSQSNLFLPPEHTSLLSRDFAAESQLIHLGYKYGGPRFRFTLGFVEDLLSSLSESDFVLFTELGWNF